MANNALAELTGMPPGLESLLNWPALHPATAASPSSTASSASKSPTKSRTNPAPSSSASTGTAKHEDPLSLPQAFGFPTAAFTPLPPPFHDAGDPDDVSFTQLLHALSTMPPHPAGPAPKTRGGGGVGGAASPTLSHPPSTTLARKIRRLLSTNPPTAARRKRAATASDPLVNPKLRAKHHPSTSHHRRASVSATPPTVHPYAFAFPPRHRSTPAAPSPPFPYPMHFYPHPFHPAAFYPHPSYPQQPPAQPLDPVSSSPTASSSPPIVPHPWPHDPDAYAMWASGFVGSLNAWAWAAAAAAAAAAAVPSPPTSAQDVGSDATSSASSTPSRSPSPASHDPEDDPDVDVDAPPPSRRTAPAATAPTPIPDALLRSLLAASGGSHRRSTTGADLRAAAAAAAGTDPAAVFGVGGVPGPIASILAADDTSSPASPPRTPRGDVADVLRRLRTELGGVEPSWTAAQPARPAGLAFGHAGDAGLSASPSLEALLGDVDEPAPPAAVDDAGMAVAALGLAEDVVWQDHGRRWSVVSGVMSDAGGAPLPLTPTEAADMLFGTADGAGEELGIEMEELMGARLSAEELVMFGAGEVGAGEEAEESESGEERGGEDGGVTTGFPVPPPPPPRHLFHPATYAALAAPAAAFGFPDVARMAEPETRGAAGPGFLMDARQGRGRGAASGRTKRTVERMATEESEGEAAEKEVAGPSTKQVRKKAKRAQPVPSAKPPPAASTSTAPLAYVCKEPGCGNAYPTREKLKSHRRIHRLKPEFPCPFPACGKMLCRKQDRDRHAATHLQTKPWGPCEMCGRRFSRKDGFARHVARGGCRGRRGGEEEGEDEE
ncbi:hypothetical protein HDU96_009298 [Phlyctochytrium bullatum]|nr:hypothetical protein HDU96_009298 [Phlyctochytrium bullatum]